MTAPELPTDLSRLRVLLVDDNAALRGALRVSLNAFGCAQVIEADTVDRALDVLASRPVDLVITDWKMRPRDGLDFVRTLRRKPASPTAFIPVIMLSGYSDRQRIAEATAAGVDTFLVKPFTAASLAGALSETLNRFSGHADTGHAAHSPAN
ncbi:MULTISPECIES: response regulator [Alphaproteobacteria]|uniref:response regulator n=1 Tax=Alphaproteobacteria TaxID=28211 RepID=UPI0032980690